MFSTMNSIFPPYRKMAMVYKYEVLTTNMRHYQLRFLNISHKIIEKNKYKYTDVTILVKFDTCMLKMIRCQTTIWWHHLDRPCTSRASYHQCAAFQICLIYHNFFHLHLNLVRLHFFPSIFSAFSFSLTNIFHIKKSSQQFFFCSAFNTIFGLPFKDSETYIFFIDLIIRQWFPTWVRPIS